MMVAPPTPPPLKSPVAASLTKEERQLASFLRTNVLAAFRQCPDDAERRVDVYLALNEVLRLEDTRGLVRILQHFLPSVLEEIRRDLDRTTTRDCLHLALRTLSYYLNHQTLAMAFPDLQVEAFLSDLMSRLASTQDEATYKLCVWCLTVQKFDLTRLDFLPRIVEALVLAIINPFDSRPIAIEAIKGIHLFTCKFKSLMLGHHATVRVWFRPMVSRLVSSDRTTRHHVALALLEAAVYAQTHEWSVEIQDEMASALEEYAMPTIQTHRTHERYQDALIVWKIVLMLMRRKLATDVDRLNDLLSTADLLLRHTDANVRLQAMEGWRHVVEVFRVNKDWVFDKHVIILLLRPILECLETEVTLNVVHAAMSTWRVLVAAAVEDFNAFCEAQSLSVDAIQRSAKKIKWKKWLEDVVRKVVVVVLERERNSTVSSTESSFVAVFNVLDSTIREMFSATVLATNVVELPAPSNSPDSSIGSSTTAASTNNSELCSRDQVRPPIPAMDLSERDDQILDAELLQYSASASMSNLGEPPHPLVPSCKPLSGHLLSLAIILPEVLKTVERLGQASNRSEQERRCQQLGLVIWDGFCTRLARACTQEQIDQGADKMRLRLVRFSLDFTFGISQSSTTASGSLDSEASVLMPSVQTEAVMTAVDLINGSRAQMHSTQAFWWQLRLLQRVINIATSVDELHGLFHHPKSRLSQQLLNRVDRIVELNSVYREWLAPWDQQAAKDQSDVRIDFSAKSATILCVLLYLVLNLGLSFDTDSARSDSVSHEHLWEIVSVYDEVIEAIHKCEDLQFPSSTIVVRFCDFVLKTPSAAKALLERDPQNESWSESGTGRLLKMCTRLSSRSEETQENAAALLELQRSPVQETAPSATNPSDVPSRDAPHEVASNPQTAAAATSDSATSPCLLQSKRNILASVARLRNADTSSPPPPPSTTTPTTPSRSKIHDASTPLPPPLSTPQTPVRSTKSALKAATSTPSSTTSATPTRSAPTASETQQSGPVYPELVDSTDPIAHIYAQLPFVFRQIAPFHKIETVGHLASKTVEQVKKLGLKDAPATVRKALTEYQAQRARSKLPPGINSPFRQRLQSTPAKTPVVLPSPSSKRILKRPSTDSPNRLPVTPLPFESPPQRKRARRSLTELTGDGDDESGNTIVRESSSGTPWSEQRVKFRLDTGDGSSRITCPGSDSQDVSDVKQEKETPHEKLESLFLKMDQHLRRAHHYATKIIEEEESFHSANASLGEETSIASYLMSSLQSSSKEVTDLGSLLHACINRRLERMDPSRVGSGSSDQRETSTRDSKGMQH